MILRLCLFQKQERAFTLPLFFSLLHVVFCQQLCDPRTLPGPNPPCPHYLLGAFVVDGAGTVLPEVRPDLPEQGEGAGRPQGHRLPDLRLRQRVRHEQQPARVRGIASRETNREREGERRGGGAQTRTRRKERCGGLRVTKIVIVDISPGPSGVPNPFLRKRWEFLGRIGRSLTPTIRTSLCCFVLPSKDRPCAAFCHYLPYPRLDRSTTGAENVEPVARCLYYHCRKIKNPVLSRQQRKIERTPTNWVDTRGSQDGLHAAPHRLFPPPHPPPRLRPRPPPEDGGTARRRGEAARRHEGGPARRASTERLSASPED